MKKVLLMTDFSESAEKAINLALTMLNATPVEFTVMYAYASLEPPLESSYPIDTELSKQTMKILEKYKTKLEKNNPFPFHTFKAELIGTSPESAAFILNEHNHYDLIVAGATGSGNNLFLGSVATNITRNINTNVLIVPSNLTIQSTKKIVLAVDYQDVESFEIFDFLKHIADRKNAEITILTILKDNQTPNDLDSFLKYQYHDSFKDFKTFDYFINENDAQTGLKEYLESHKVDLLALVTRHHSFYDVVFNRSVSRQIVYNPTIPILCIYDKKVDNFLVETLSDELVTF